MKDSLCRAFTALRKARVTGYASACCCLLAVLLLVDGLQALMRDDFTHLDLPLGGQALLSGAMPLQAKNYTDINASIEGIAGLRFTPMASFKGFWMGTAMWRAELDASAATVPGKATLTITDLVPAKSTTSNATLLVQNPTQIYSITVWPSAEAMQAAHFSFCHRVTGLSAFLFAGLSVFCGIVLGAGHAFFYQTAQSALAVEGVFVIHGMCKTDAGYQAAFSPGSGNDLQLLQRVILLSPDGAAQREGVLSECAPNKHSALFPLEGLAPRYGWLLRCAPETEPGNATACPAQKRK